MNDTGTTTHATARRRDDRRFAKPSKPLIRAGDMTCMVLITVAAALLAGLLALPFTMPGRAFAEPATAFGAADFALPESMRTASPLT